jgi:hypothetical protein
MAESDSSFIIEDLKVLYCTMKTKVGQKWYQSLALSLLFSR